MKPDEVISSEMLEKKEDIEQESKLETENLMRELEKNLQTARAERDSTEAKYGKESECRRVDEAYETFKSRKSILAKKLVEYNTLVEEVEELHLKVGEIQLEFRQDESIIQSFAQISKHRESLKIAQDQLAMYKLQEQQKISKESNPVEMKKSLATGEVVELEPVESESVESKKAKMITLEDDVNRAERLIQEMKNHIDTTIQEQHTKKKEDRSSEYLNFLRSITSKEELIPQKKIELDSANRSCSVAKKEFEELMSVQNAEQALVEVTLKIDNSKKSDDELDAIAIAITAFAHIKF
jgi:hypothetical protein